MEFIEVVEKEEFLYSGFVHDLNVDEDHSYNIEGYAVHNSGAGSLVVCLLGITKIDPIKYGLYFERFLNEKRLDPPDIDLDFDSKTRYKIEVYLKQKYGEHAVSHVISFGTFGIKNSIRDTFRVYYGTDKKDEVNKLSKCLENDDTDFDLALVKMIALEGDWAKEFIEKHKKQFDIAKVLVGKNRHYSMHAGGIIIAPDYLEKFIPIMKIKDQISTGYPEGGDTRLMTDAGLMKFDILGLNACSIINDTFRQIKNVSISSIIDNDDDPKVLEQFTIGNTFSIFQFEGKNITKFIKRAKPTKFIDLVAVNALYRPAVIQAGGLEMYLKNKKNYDYEKSKHDPFERILSDSYGVMCLGKGTNIDIDDFHTEKIENLKFEQEILSISNYNKIKKGNVDKVFHKKKKGMLLTLSTGTQLIASEEHRFLTAFGDKQVKDLQICQLGRKNSGVMGDVLFEKWVVSKNNIFIDSRKIYLFGLTVGDGTFSLFGISLGFEEDAEKVRQLLEEVYPTNISEKKFHLRAWYVKSVKKIKNPNIRNPIDQFHYDMYKDENFDFKKLKSHNKFLPKFVIDLNEKNRIDLLRGLWDSDGSYINYIYKSVSIRLLKDIARLLSSLKIAYSFRNKGYGSYVLVLDITRFNLLVGKPFLPNKKFNNKHRYVAVLRNVYNEILKEKRFNCDIFKSKTKKRCNFRHGSNVIASLTRCYNKRNLIKTEFFKEIYEETYEETYLGDTRPVFIQEIKHCDETDFYDIQMKDQKHPYFFANGVISHNSYQEQTMQVFQELGGFTLAEADLTRHVFKLLFKGNTNYSDFNEMMTKFREGCRKTTNYDDKRIEEIMEKMKNFSKYAFNKSHSCAYAMMAYIMMYLRTYYPNQYFSSLLSNTENTEAMQDGKKVNLFQNYVTEIQKNFNIKICKPDINESGAHNFRIKEDGSLVYALGHIKDVGSKAAVNIEENQPYTSFKEFISKVTRRIVNKRVIRALIYSEAIKFDDTAELFKKEIGEEIDTTNFLQKQFDYTGLVASQDLKEATNREYSLKGVEKAAAQGKTLSKRYAIPIIVFVSKFRRLAGNSKRTGRPYVMYFATIYDGTTRIDDCILNDAEGLNIKEGDLVSGQLYFDEAKNKKYSDHVFYLGDIKKIKNTEKYDALGKLNLSTTPKVETLEKSQQPKLISRKKSHQVICDVPIQLISRKKRMAVEETTNDMVDKNMPKLISRKKKR